MHQVFLVLDANILIRSVLGRKVRDMLLAYYEQVIFLVPDVCVVDAAKYLPTLFEKRNLPVQPALAALENLNSFIQIVEDTIYEPYMIEAKKRIERRDLQDWPIVATALAFNSPVWTDDQDFFGSGLPVWTSDRIHLFFEGLK